jgi:hypothetical protein
MLDEGFEIVNGLWSGEPFAFDVIITTSRRAIFCQTRAAAAHPGLGSGQLAA